MSESLLCGFRRSERLPLRVRSVLVRHKVFPLSQSSGPGEKRGPWLRFLALIESEASKHKQM